MENSMAAGFAGFTFMFIFVTVIGIISLIGTAFWIWMLIDCIKNEGINQNNEKVIWILVLIFTHVLGAIIYFFVGRPKNVPQTSVTPPPV